MNKNIDIVSKKDRSKIILAAGRLTKQKNFLYLLKEFAKFLINNKNYKLIILGEGEKKSEIQYYIKKNNISGHVFLKGHVKNIFSYMKNSDLFVLSSLWEDPGFVIVEAAFSNLFVISSNCPNGPREILSNGKGGSLFKTGNADDLTKKIKELLNNQYIIRKKVNYAYQAINRFDEEKNLKKYFMLISSLI